MKRYLLPNEGNVYKANLHTHTNISDGHFSPEETKKLYKDKGYSVVAYTDHEVIVPHTDLWDEDFLAITGYEAHFSEDKPLPFKSKKLCHLNLYSKDPNNSVSSIWTSKNYCYDKVEQFTSEEQKKLPDYNRVHSIDGINEMVEISSNEGFLVCYNHPEYNLHDYTDYAGLKGLWGVEIHNTGSTNGGYIETGVPYEDLLRLGNRIFPVAADDMHVFEDAFGGWTMIKAEKLDYDAVMRALERGDLYSTTGPDINELYIEDGVVYVSCSEAASIVLHTERRQKYSVMGDGLTEARFDINAHINALRSEKERPREPYIRVTVTDKYGKIAYSRAYFLDELELI